MCVYIYVINMMYMMCIGGGMQGHLLARQLCCVCVRVCTYVYVYICIEYVCVYVYICINHMVYMMYICG